MWERGGMVCGQQYSIGNHLGSWRCHCRRCYLAMKGDVAHINVAELEVVIKGVNLALKWGLWEIDVVWLSLWLLGLNWTYSREESVNEKNCGDAHKALVMDAEEIDLRVWSSRSPLCHQRWTGETWLRGWGKNASRCMMSL